MWHTLLFSNNNNINNNIDDNISCKTTLISVFIVIIFRSLFDAFLFIEFFIYTFDRDLWPLFIVGLLWSIIKLIICYLMLYNIIKFFFIVFAYFNCSFSNIYFHLFWEWFIAPKYIIKLLRHFIHGKTWKFTYLFHKKYWI